MKNKVQLITYADRLGDGTLKSMTDILRTRFDGVYDGVHILPFFTPFDGADAGFDPIDHTKVDERLGSWDDVAELSKTHNIMVDAIVNHMSWQSKQFQDVLAKGEESEYYPMFLTMSSVFPNGATEEDLAGIYRPRPGLPFTHYKFAGKTRLVWVSFTPQQVDIDTDSDKGWEYLMSIFDQMAASHVSYIRLDAVGYGAKEAGTSCFMTPKTFKLISRLREEGMKRGLEILIEVHSYYKKQVEIASKVDRVYDFALPPLLLHALSTGHVEPVAHWTDIRPNNAVTVLDTHDGIEERRRTRRRAGAECRHDLRAVAARSAVHGVLRPPETLAESSPHGRRTAAVGPTAVPATVPPGASNRLSVPNVPAPDTRKTRCGAKPRSAGSSAQAQISKVWAVRKPPTFACVTVGFGHDRHVGDASPNEVRTIQKEVRPPELSGTCPHSAESRRQVAARHTRPDPRRRV